MPIILVGLNHRTAPVHVREQVALKDAGLQAALKALVATGRPGTVATSHHPAPEAVIVSTCNRLELYMVAEDRETTWAAFDRCMADRTMGLRSHVYMLEGRAAVSHLLRVASGLDSLVLGESQILGQVAQALEQAQAARTVGSILTHLFAQAVHTGKRARNETRIERHTTSVSHAAALLAQSEVGELGTVRTVVVGAGEVAELAGRALRMRGARDLAWINRTDARAEALARTVGGRPFRWSQLDEALRWTDVIITATGAPAAVIHADQVAGLLSTRGARPLLFIDLALPRDVDEAVERLPGVKRYDLDDLNAILDINMAERRAAVPDVEAIIDAELDAFFGWLDSRHVVPVIVELRRKVHQLARAEVARAAGRLDGEDQRSHELIERVAERIVNKLLHDPTERLKTHAANGNGNAYAQAIRDLFALDESPDLPGRTGVSRHETVHVSSVVA
jgi:glutamyl-tRNA reductase